MTQTSLERCLPNEVCVRNKTDTWPAQGTLPGYGRRLFRLALKLSAFIMAFYVAWYGLQWSVELMRIYETFALSWPITTKAMTSGIAYLLGDILAQRLEAISLRTQRGLHATDPSEPVDFVRALRSGGAGFVGHGPQLHAWGVFLEKYVVLGTSPCAKRIAVLVKILLDQTIFTLYVNGSYCALVEALQGASMSQIWHRLRTSAWPTLRSSWCFWPLVHTLTFTVIPHHLRVLWIDTVEVLWVAVLSTIASRAEEGCVAPRAPKQGTVRVKRAL